MASIEFEWGLRPEVVAVVGIDQIAIGFASISLCSRTAGRWRCMRPRRAARPAGSAKQAIKQPGTVAIDRTSHHWIVEFVDGWIDRARMNN